MDPRYHQKKALADFFAYPFSQQLPISNIKKVMLKVQGTMWSTSHKTEEAAMRKKQVKLLTEALLYQWKQLICPNPLYCFFREGTAWKLGGEFITICAILFLAMMQKTIKTAMFGLPI